VKYLIQWKGFTAEGDTWKRRENLKNAEELIKEFEQEGIEVRRQVEEEEEYKRMELPGRFTAKVLYGWDDQKFEEEYLNKLEKNWKRWKGDRKINESEHLKRIEERIEEDKRKRLESRTFLWRRNLKRGVISRSLMVDFILLSFFTLFYFSFLFSFLFLFLEQLGLEFISHAVTSVTN